MKLPEPLTPIAYPSSIEEIEALRLFHKKEISPEMLGIHAINSGVLHDSPSRSVMTSQHITQHLVFSDMEPPVTSTGTEYELGKYTFGIRMPENGKIVKTIQRYSIGAGTSGVNGQPELTIIYQKESNHQLDVFHIKQWGCFHQYFGYANKVKSGFNLLRPNVFIPKDTVFVDTPAVEDDGSYNYGANFEIAAMDVPGVADDGVIVSRSCLERMKIKIYETREKSFGSKDFPINLNGGEDEYKIFQEIGEYIRHDGLIMATRSYSDRMAPAIMGARDLRTVDHIFDEKLYSRETSLRSPSERYTKRAGKVVDIQVIRNNDSARYLPPTMTKQLDRYAKALKTYYGELLDCETRLSMENRRVGGDGKLFMSPELQNLLTRARGITGQGGNRFQGNISLQYRRTPLDEYNVTFVIEHELTPNLGWKVTGLNGDTKSIF